MTIEAVKKELSEQQKAFCEYYVINLNATQAAVEAGYSEKTARQQGSRLLSNVYIQEYIKVLLEELEDKRIAKAVEVMEFLTSTMRGEIKDQFDLDPSLQDRMKAAELLGKRYKLFTDKHEIEGKLEAVTIVNDIPKPDDAG